MAKDSEKEEPKKTYACPECEGEGGCLDDDNNDWQTCNYCGGKRAVNMIEFLDWENWKCEVYS